MAGSAANTVYTDLFRRQPARPAVVAPRAPVAQPAPAPSSGAASAYAASQAAALSGGPIAPYSGAPAAGSSVGSYTQGYDNPGGGFTPGGYTPSARTTGNGPVTPTPQNLPSMNGLSAALAQTPLDAISGGDGSALRKDLGTRQPPSLQALLQGLRY